MTTINGYSVSIPQGDSGGFTVVTSGYSFGADDRALFTLKDGNKKTIRREVMTITDGAVAIEFAPAETRKMPVGDYTWELRFITDATFDGNNVLTGGTDIDTPRTEMRLSITRVQGEI